MFLDLLRMFNSAYILTFLLVGKQYFGVQESQAPLIIIQNNDGKKYLKPKLDADQIAPWLKDYKVASVLHLMHCFRIDDKTYSFLL